jgi:hypothetical protein
MQEKSLLIGLVYLFVTISFGAAAWAVYRDEARYARKELHLWTCLIGTAFFAFMAACSLF